MSPTTTTQPALRPDLAAVAATVESAFRPAGQPRTEAERAANLRRFAAAQCKLGRAQLNAISSRRRWLKAIAAAGNPGVSRFYALPTPAQFAKTLAFVQSCRRRAAEARAQARAIEAGSKAQASSARAAA